LDAYSQQGPDDKMHDGSGGDHPGTARAGSHAPRQIASHRGPETKSSPSTAARLRLFDCRTSPARTTGIAVEKTRRMQITVERMRTWLPRAAHHIAGPIHFSLRSFFSICAGYHRRRNFPRPGAPEEMRRRAALKCRHGRQYNGRWGTRSHWRLLRGAARLHGSCEP
jgi:hypothetical protein